MNNNIFIDKVLLANKAQELRTEKQNMENIFNNIKNDIEGMVDYWKGESGEEAYNILKEYSQSFPNIISEIEKNIAFIDKAIESYEKMEKAIINQMDQNSQIEIL